MTRKLSIILFALFLLSLCVAARGEEPTYYLVTSEHDRNDPPRADGTRWWVRVYPSKEDALRSMDGNRNRQQMYRLESVPLEIYVDQETVIRWRWREKE